MFWIYRRLCNTFLKNIFRIYFPSSLRDKQFSASMDAHSWKIHSMYNLNINQLWSLLHFLPGVNQVNGRDSELNDILSWPSGRHPRLAELIDWCPPDKPLGKIILYLVSGREAPTVSVWPEGVQIVRPGSSARLQCRIHRGAPEPVLTWSRPSGRTLSTNTHLLPDGVLRWVSTLYGIQKKFSGTAISKTFFKS